MRNFTEVVSEGFIWGVGITRPKAGQERRAALFITGMLIGAIVPAIVLFLFVISRF